MLVCVHTHHLLKMIMKMKLLENTPHTAFAVFCTVLHSTAALTAAVVAYGGFGYSVACLTSWKIKNRNDLLLARPIFFNYFFIILLAFHEN